MMENPDENARVVNGEEGGAGDAGDLSCIDSSRKSEELYQKDQLYLRSLLPEEVAKIIDCMALFIKNFICKYNAMCNEFKGLERYTVLGEGPE